MKFSKSLKNSVYRVTVKQVAVKTCVFSKLDSPVFNSKLITKHNHHT